MSSQSDSEFATSVLSAVTAAAPDAIIAATADLLSADPVAKEARGSVLGLPTAKRLVEAHAGQITVECPDSGGTAVMVRLPAEPNPSRSPASR